MESHIQIFDTTLRDGEQTPGVNFSFDERLSIAKQLEKWGVDVIEAGFPASSTGSFKSVEAISKALTTTAVCGLARCKKSDIDAVYEATKCAAKPRVHVFIATSPIHLEHKLKMTQEEVLESIKEHVSYAKSLFDVVQFSPEDASRTDQPFLIKSVQTAVDAGATIINIPDTVGYSYPSEYGVIFKSLITNVKSEKEIIYSAHCHDDLGMAVANSLAAIENGAKRIEGTVNGIGERAGNTALEEIALALYVRKDHYGIETKLKLEQTKLTSDLISRYAGIRVPRNKAIVGQNAFSHESGIHQDGVLKNPETYEIMTPQLVGISKNELPLGKLSGKHAFAEKLKTLGYDIEPKQQIELFKQFKAVADKKKSVSDRDIHAIIQGSEHEQNAIYQVETLQLQYVSNGLQSAVVVIKDKKGHIYQDSSIGTGSIVAIYNAVDRIFKKDSELIDYRIDSVTEGTDAQAEVHVELVIENQHVNGIGIDHDILQASCKAYVEAHAKYIAQDLEKVGNK
ncbi:2-isopropylmalate synthase [Mycobacteroides abscessus subsp. abscessus]|uniref:2-isopropylmalate synthase n=1 Tax=Staphylococcus TaxID=1279 RepID=UPI0008A382BE|nr:MULTISPECIES: 2-isopropylmalate synthase [Staphylococcus]OFM56562.1 2-isopropylmalate synthase [Staphylococcus sp. HMSC059G05]SKU70379.1 2-isopropylmalate synthase [Mycobacteroides abscessus subsp. abscessus]MBC3060742.1 2-isopropylmalate synthase [Staphylococcus hominis]MBF9286630.1 2-isopropylmalate synthase [Staphylococcus epidermidis]MCK6226346.1 2-isopropylmalate synthase [Staphylococcus hominis]